MNIEEKKNIYFLFFQISLYFYKQSWLYLSQPSITDNCSWDMLSARPLRLCILLADAKRDVLILSILHILVPLCSCQGGLLKDPGLFSQSNMLMMMFSPTLKLLAFATVICPCCIENLYAVTFSERTYNPCTLTYII